MDPNTTIAKLKTFFENSSEVKFAVLFGSIPKGRDNKLSDVDVAVMVEKRGRRAKEEIQNPKSKIQNSEGEIVGAQQAAPNNAEGYGYRAELTSDLMKLLKTNDVDVLLLNDAPPLLRYEVLRYGKPIVVNDRSAWSEFQIQTIREYQDFKRIFAVHKRNFMNKNENMSEDRNAIIRKLLDLERYIDQLRRLQRYSYEDIATDLEKLWAIERGLQLCIQTVLDIGNQVLAELGESQIETYADVIDLLGERNIISPEFAIRIRGMVGFRNILVHRYTEVNVEEVYELLQNRLDDFATFIEQIRQHLSNL